MPRSWLLKCFFFDLPHSGLLRMDMTSTPSTLSSGSPCSRISMRSSTTTTWTARSVSSAKSWGSPNTTEPLPRSSSPDSSKFVVIITMTCSLWSTMISHSESTLVVKLNFTFSGNDSWLLKPILIVVVLLFSRYAKYLEVLSLPDDMRELLDEYLDANSRAEQNKACEEFFQCPYSIKDSMKRNADGNSL